MAYPRSSVPSRNRQNFVELTARRRCVEPVDNQPREFLFLHRVQIVTLANGMTRGGGTFNLPTEPVGTDMPRTRMTGRRVECMDGAKHIVGVRLHAIRDGDIKGSMALP
jgi:hypothetical protein